MGYIYKPKYKDKNGISHESNIYWIKFYQDGKPCRESSESSVEKESLALLKIREGEVEKGNNPGGSFKKVRYDELAKDFLTFGGMKVVKITSDMVRKYIEKRMKSGAENSSINRELAALKTMLNLGIEETPPKVNRVPSIPMLPEDNVKTGYFEEIMFDVFYAWWLENAPEYAGFILFGYMVPWRVDNIRSLTWDRIDMNQKVIRLCTGHKE